MSKKYKNYENHNVKPLQGKKHVFLVRDTDLTRKVKILVVLICSVPRMRYSLDLIYKTG